MRAWFFSVYFSPGHLFIVFIHSCSNLAQVFTYHRNCQNHRWKESFGSFRRNKTNTTQWRNANMQWIKKVCVNVYKATARGRSNSICKEGCRFSMGWCMREPYCPLSSAVCNATIPILPLFEMAESACSPFCYVLHYLLFIKFISAFYHVCVTGQLL
jgi:hypothetical protein